MKNLDVDAEQNKNKNLGHLQKEMNRIQMEGSENRKKRHFFLEAALLRQHSWECKDTP